MKSGIARVRELYPDDSGYAAALKGPGNWPIIVRRNPMGVVKLPGVSYIGENGELSLPLSGPRYAAFFEDLYGIRAGVLCLATSNSLIDGLAVLLRDEFAAASMVKKVSGACRQAIVTSIIALVTGRPDLYPPSLIRAATALASERELDRGMIDRVLARVA